MTDKLRVVVVGGGIGAAHIQAYKQMPDRFEVAGLCEIDKDRGARVCKTNGIPNLIPEFDDLCAMPDIDIIDICTPSYLHYEMALQALQAGKNVVCEKPLAASLREVDDLIRAEKASQKTIMPIFQYRFGHGLQKLKLLVDEGLTGPAYLTTVETAWRRRPEYYAVPWRGKWATELGGATLTLAIHAHDTLNYISGPASQVFARTATLVNPIETEDTMSASLAMEGGSLASLSVTTGSAVEISRHRFCFANLTAESQTAPYTSSSDPWSFAADTPEIHQQIEDVLAGFQPLPEGFAGQFYRFYDALVNGSELPVTLAGARRSIELITAIYHSARTGASVDLPLDASHPLYGGWV